MFAGSSAVEVLPFLTTHGVRPKFADAVCMGSRPIPPCDEAKAGVDLAGEDLGALDKSISNIPPGCVSQRSTAWKARLDLIDRLQTAVQPITGSWRLPDGTCEAGVIVRQSGQALIATSGKDLHIERWTALSEGGVRAETIWPADSTDVYRYRMAGDRMVIENVTQSKSWELERCTG